MEPLYMKKNKKNRPTAGSKIAAGFMALLLIGGSIYYVVGLLWNHQKTLRCSVSQVTGLAFFPLPIRKANQSRIKSVQNKVTVAEYFFTSCPSICPMMNANFKQVYEKFKTNPDFVILSHTVDPDKDSVPVLKAYAEPAGCRKLRDGSF